MLVEAVRLVDTIRRRIGGGAPTGDVWGDATSEAWGDHIATGAPECRYCPVCRAIAASRAAGPDVLGHVVSAGESLYAAMRDAVAAYERTGQRPSGPAEAGRQGD